MTSGGGTRAGNDGPLLAFLLLCCTATHARTLVEPGGGGAAAADVLDAAAALQAGCSDSQACACGASIFELKGFDGTTYPFQARAGSVYNLLSECSHQVNARFARRGSHGAAWLVHALIKHLPDSVSVRLVEGGRMEVEVNNVVLVAQPGTLATQTLPGGTTVVLRRRGAGAGGDDERVLVATPELSLALRVPVATPGRLELLVLAVSPYLCDMHGLLGQTYHRRYSVATTAQAPFALEGADWDYELAAIDSDVFTFNHFHRGERVLCGGEGGCGTGGSLSTAVTAQ